MTSACQACEEWLVCRDMLKGCAREILKTLESVKPDPSAERMNPSSSIPGEKMDGAKP